MKDTLRPLLDDLDDRSRTIIELRYGLYTYNRTLEEIGIECGVTRERARQMEGRTLKHLTATVGPALQNMLNREAAERTPWTDLALTICEISTEDLLEVSS